MSQLSRRVVSVLLSRGPKRGTISHEVITVLTAVIAGLVFWVMRTHR